MFDLNNPAFTVPTMIVIIFVALLRFNATAVIRGEVRRHLTRLLDYGQWLVCVTSPGGQTSTAEASLIRVMALNRREVVTYSNPIRRLLVAQDFTALTEDNNFKAIDGHGSIRFIVLGRAVDDGIEFKLVNRDGVVLSSHTFKGSEYKFQPERAWKALISGVQLSYELKGGKRLYKQP